MITEGVYNDDVVRAEDHFSMRRGMWPRPLPLEPGDRFGRLTALCPMQSSRQGHKRWLFLCTCGVEKEIIVFSVKHGITRSCGCLLRETAARTAFRHGHLLGGKSPTYSCWSAMTQRCLNPRHRGYKRYGGSGISICRRWRLFANFLEDMGERPSLGHSIDRIDNHGPYSPANCRWATARQQRRNRGKYVRGPKLTIEQVRELRRRRSAGALLSTLAAEYGITDLHAGKIANRVVWQEA